MKSTTHFISVISLFVSLFLTSCSGDDSGQSDGTSTGDYFPMKVNNIWNFNADGNIEQLKVVGTNEFGGTTYYELQDEGDDFGLNIQNWITKKGATYYQKIADVNTVQNGVTVNIKGYQMPMFKDDLAVNETWSGTLRPKVTFNYKKENQPVESHIREVYDRGNGAGILLYNSSKKTVILTRQFRLPTFLKV